MWHGLFGRFGGAGFPRLFLGGSSTYVSGFSMRSFDNLSHGVQMVGHKVARLLGRFGGGSPLHLDPATFSQRGPAPLHPIGASTPLSYRPASNSPKSNISVGSTFSGFDFFVNSVFKGIP